MKKISIYFLTLCLLMSCINILVIANEPPGNFALQIGEYFLMGKYKESPILWRCVDNDENGSLILSDKILCLKEFDKGWYNGSGSHSRRTKNANPLFLGLSNYWADSDIRLWLNSTAKEGEGDWHCPAYQNEEGFLSNNNFSENERMVIKETTQRSLLDPYDEFLATSGSKQNDAVGSYEYFDEEEYNEIYSEYITDKVFLPDIKQMWQLYKNSDILGDYQYATVTKEASEEAKGISPYFVPNENETWYYWLRTPYGGIYGNPRDGQDTGGRTYYATSNGRISHNYSNDYSTGVRPAFYLNEENAVKLSGSGTEEDPYILTGKESEEIGVFCNGTKLEFDQPPIMESDRVLVPLRVIFETLGADIEWDGTTQTVTAVRGETNISLQIDSNMMYKNGEAIELDVPARLLNDRTLVPIRAVSEAMEAKVEWIQEDKTVVITTQ